MSNERFINGFSKNSKIKPSKNKCVIVLGKCVMENKKISNPNIQAIIRFFDSSPGENVSKSNLVVNSYINNFDGEISQRNEVVKADIQIKQINIGEKPCEDK